MICKYFSDLKGDCGRISSPTLNIKTNTNPLSGNALIKSPVRIQMGSLWRLGHEQPLRSADYNRRLLKNWDVNLIIGVYSEDCSYQSSSAAAGIRRAAAPWDGPHHVNR